MNILVTGGAGFIGSHIVDAYLNLGHRVIILDNLSSGKKENIASGGVFYEMDLLDPRVEKLIKDEHIEIINHHAAQISVTHSVAHPGEDANTNILGSIKLLEAAKSCGVKQFIFASTGGAIYGLQDVFPADESHACRPESPYAISKFSVENYLHYYRKTYGLNTTILRYSNVYGPRQDPHGEAGVVAIFCQKLLSKSQAIIYGDGEQTRDFVSVQDVAQANVLAITHSLAGIYNIGTGKETTVNELFHHIAQMAGNNVSAQHAPARKGELQRSVIDPGRFQKSTDWKPGMPIKEGLGKTYEFFSRQTNPPA
ncbi:MAG: NAD-dependent epimerase/dehydratase family protein [Nitrospinae bacterium]|nr:NAD-dependent epimerase/dehydratase family protein [Nitrospinota bacterium]